MNESEKLIFIKNKFNNKLSNYEYIENNKIVDLPFGTNLKYISKNSLNKVRSGYLKEVYDGNIIELYLNSKNIWHIYLDKFYVFQKKSKNDILRSALQSLLDTDFNILKEKNNTNEKNNDEIFDKIIINKKKPINMNIKYLEDIVKSYNNVDYEDNNNVDISSNMKY